MKTIIKDLIFQAALSAHKAGDLPSDEFPAITLEEPKVESQGDFSTNMAMVMAKLQKMAPVKIAGAILKHMDCNGPVIEKAEVAGPGFMNFFVKKEAWYPVIDSVFDEADSYGSSDFGKGTSVMVEFVSSNPTGPLHVGHGRGAAVGDSVAGILSFCGFDVTREYYINDSGRQINTLGTSVYFRYLELFGQEIEFPEECYQGDYIADIAAAVKQDKGEAFLGSDREEAIGYCARFAAKSILASIAADLNVFGVGFDTWFSEQSLYDSGKVDGAIEVLKNKGIIYENEGAQWFKTSDYGDAKDRVVVRSNGQTTYFASDIAYHKDKFDRGFDRLIDVWGADHHGYIPRINASISALDRDSDDFDVVLVQLVNLLRDGAPVAMSTRSGEFVTLKDVVDEVGADAARFIFLTRHHDSPLDFDLELAKRKTNDNPVYYVQYVHARISSILRKALDEKGIGEPVRGEIDSPRLGEPEEIGLIKAMWRYPQVVETAGRNLEPHRITYYLMNLASLFHSYYNKHKVLTDDTELTLSRLYLIKAVRTVIKNGLTLLGVSAPEQM